MARPNQQSSSVNNAEILAALLSKKQPETTSRITDAVVDSLGDITEFTGRISSAISGDRYEDGQKMEFLRQTKQRSERWAKLGSELGLSPEQVAQIIKS